MKITRPLYALAVGLMATSACAQTAGKPLNLKLPPSDLPPASASAAAPAQAKSASSVPGDDSPGVYYGDTSGRTYANSVSDEGSACDDSTYNKAQLHGSVGMGVVAGNHFGGSYQGGEANLSKRFGSCEEPSGGISISVGSSSGRFHDH
jgi:hypothetical protein